MHWGTYQGWILQDLENTHHGLSSERGFALFRNQEVVELSPFEMFFAWDKDCVSCWEAIRRIVYRVEKLSERLSPW